MTEIVTNQTLIDQIQDAGKRTRELFDELDDEQIMGPKLSIVNPILWEIGHVAWFYENFILRMLYGYEPAWEKGDEIYDSIEIEHFVRWDLPMLQRDEALDYIGTIQSRLFERLDGDMASEQDSFIYQFAAYHHDMHNEAYTYSRQTLSYPAPTFETAAGFDPSSVTTGNFSGDAEIPGGTFHLGSRPEDPFYFDNEKWGHDVTLYPFRISRTAVTNREFAEFVDDGGYERRDLWHDIGWGWRQSHEAGHPVYWLPNGPGKWRLRHFDREMDLPPDQPVNHVNWYEASAFCNWAGRRLPTEIEWEVAASAEPSGNGGGLSGKKRRYPWGDDPDTASRANLDGRIVGCADVTAFPDGDSAFGCRQMLGNVWEWTSTTFEPYPGFHPDSYKEYSLPVFGTRKVLRGGAWATRSRMITNTYRNFFTPERRDVFAGFRTCAPHDWPQPG